MSGANVGVLVGDPVNRRSGMSNSSGKAYRRRSITFPSKDLLCIQQHKDMSPLPKLHRCGEGGSCYSSAYTTFTQDVKHTNVSTQCNVKNNNAKQNNNNTTNNQRTRYKKRKLGMSLSCPPIFSKCVATRVSPSTTCAVVHDSIHQPSCTLRKNIRSSTNTHIDSGGSTHDSAYPILNIPCGSKTPRHGSKTAVTCQPGSADYIAFIKQTEDVHDNAIKYIDSLRNETKRTTGKCTDCLRRTQDIISWCTCHWCLMSLCYHCVNRDDVGYNSDQLQWKRYVCCRGSAEQNIRRTAIMVSCLPCLPCLSLYPVLNSILNLCLKFS